MTDFRVTDDIEIIKELLDLSNDGLAKEIGVSPETMSRWCSLEQNLSDDSLEKLYEYAFHKKIRLNRIKEQLFREECRGEHSVVLFHGAKKQLDGALSAEKSRETNDFGKGFYCGESMEQSAMFVSGYPSSSLYIVEFDRTGLSETRFFVDRDWMLTIACFRGRLGAYENHPYIRELRKNVEQADYIVAPIADNRMFAIIDSFIDGEITDIQCQHCLSATDLGNQYVFRTERALRQVIIKRHCYLCEREKQFYLTSKQEEARIGNDKVKIARKQYRGQGKYIEEIFDETNG